MKNEEKANLLKKTGNELYLKCRFNDALIKYNEALCHAETNELKSLLYGNRSSIYFVVKRYTLSLENIQLAIQHGFPKDKLMKLQERKEKCIEFLTAGEEINENDQKVADFFKLSYETHPKIPFIIDGIELKTSEKYGNHLITNRDLKTGDIIAIEPLIPFLAKLYHECCYEKCAFCLRHNFYSLIPCDGCCDMMYCSETCKEQHKEIYHAENCCPSVESHPNEDYFEASHLIVKTVLKEFDNFKEFVKLLNDPKKLTVFDVDEFSPKNILTIFCSMAQAESRKKSVAEIHDSMPLSIGNSKDVRDVIIQIKAIISTNSLELIRHIVDENTPNNGNFITMGRAVLIFGSLFNNSCDPNVDRVMVDNKMVFFVKRPIKAGEQLCISYLTKFASTPRNERQDYLEEKLDFRCDCDACKNNYPLLNDLRDAQGNPTTENVNCWSGNQNFQEKQ